jgi:hypothetical protein
MSKRMAGWLAGWLVGWLAGWRHLFSEVGQLDEDNQRQKKKNDPESPISERRIANINNQCHCPKRRCSIEFDHVQEAGTRNQRHSNGQCLTMIMQAEK